MKTKLYFSVIMGAFLSDLCATDSIERSGAYDLLPGSVSSTAHTLPLVLQPFVHPESNPGSGNTVLRLTQDQYKLYDRLIKDFPHVSVIISREEPRSTCATQGSQASVASTTVVILSQDSQESCPATLPTIVISEP